MKLKTLLIVAVIVLIILAIIMLRPSNTQMNNQKCPVSGQNVNDRDTYIYNGKEYRLCSEKCKQPLSENPSKYLCD